MASYRITAPDGVVYNVTPPEGTNPSETEILAQVQARAGGAVPRGNVVTRAYKAVAEPVTEAVGGLIGGAVGPYLAPGVTLTPEQERFIGRPVGELVPQTPLEALAIAGMLAAGPLAPLVRGAPALARILAAGRGAGGRILGGAVGGEIGGDVSGQTPGIGAAAGGGLALGGEAASAFGSKALRSLPFVKGQIAEDQARNLTGAIRSVSPELADAIAGARGGLQPSLRGGQTAAAMQETALGAGGQRALSAGMEAGIVEAERLSNNALLPGQALQRGYDLLPDITKEFITARYGPVSPNGFTVRQAQEVIGFLGETAFTQSVHGQGVSKIPLQDLRNRAVAEVVNGLQGANPAAAEAFIKVRAPYSAGQTYLELLNEGRGGPFTGTPNRIALNENAVREYISANRQELQAKLGPQGFQALLDALGGAQPGTKSLLSSGAGGPLDALMQTLGRGTNTGSINALGVPLRTIAPNFGSQYTGRPAYTLPAKLQAILDAALQRAGGAALEPAR